MDLELLTAPTKYLFCEGGTRGGISTIPEKHSEVNKKYMKDYDPDKESVYIPYLDANNLYEWAMSQPLPTHGFEWEEDEKEHANWQNYPCFLEVNLNYPKELRNAHNGLPLAPESQQSEKTNSQSQP